MPSPAGFSSTYTSTAAIYTLSLHDALPILRTTVTGPRVSNGGHGGGSTGEVRSAGLRRGVDRCFDAWPEWARIRSEEHTSELQSQSNLVCRLLLEKKKEMLRIGAWRSLGRA